MLLVVGLVSYITYMFWPLTKQREAYKPNPVKGMCLEEKIGTHTLYALSEIVVTFRSSMLLNQKYLVN